MLDHKFWSKHFEKVFIPQLERTVDVFLGRILPVLNNIEAEAEQIQEEELTRLEQSCDPNMFEYEDILNMALDAAVDHYHSMTDIRQSLINLYSIAIYHLWEQQVLTFHRRQVLHPCQENQLELITRSQFENMLREEGINVDLLPCWKKIEELQCVANTIKHAAGRAANRLHELRSDLFDHPNPIITMAITRSTTDVYSPLGGEDVYLTPEDLMEYKKALVNFWRELAGAMASD
ncbi:MAG: hypothetical protein KQJ78_17660 [Deltaproteobacteria bacterium]|nr:hypothetical protein [Deltaproteobacteria bacterium]